MLYIELAAAPFDIKPIEKLRTVLLLYVQQHITLRRLLCQHDLHSK